LQVIGVRNVHHALPTALWLLKEHGTTRPSRNGDVRVMLEPVTTMYERPRERVLFWPQRDANPFFHLYEALWMLGGKNDVSSVAYFAKNMANYSDDGKTFHGAYGYRWRRQFQFDQLATIAAALKDDSTDRRQVLQMWDSTTDLRNQRGKKDVPCNLVAHFQVNPLGSLDMTVFNRSNDIVWGCYGANAVHFSVLQEVMATWIGVPVGKYWQVSDNWHAYLDTMKPLMELTELCPMEQAAKFAPSRIVSPYGAPRMSPDDVAPGLEMEASPFRIVNTPIDVWMDDLMVFLHHGHTMGYKDVFFNKVASPMVQAFGHYKDGDLSLAMQVAQSVMATDWRLAATQWIQRRIDTRMRRQLEQELAEAQRKKKAEDDGVTEYE